MKRILYSLLALTLCSQVYGNEKFLYINDESNQPVPYASIYIKELNKAYRANHRGEVVLEDVQPGHYSVQLSVMGYTPIEHTLEIDDEESTHDLIMSKNPQSLKTVEVFGDKEVQADKLDALTRLPLAPNAQIQAISIISDKVIRDQGALTIADVTRNVPGVYTFATYGNQRESMSMRGFRGVPILKNGVRINSDFRGTGILTDMQGVENIQVLKGASAISQGVATDIGSPGGVINIVSKTPQFQNSGSVSMRYGSWQQFRPAFDVQQVLNEEQTLAFGINGVYEHSSSYRPGVSLEKMYVNPSLAWKPTERTTVIFEMDYLNDDRTPDPGTINRSANDSNAIYLIPYDYFPGFKEQRNITSNLTYAMRLQHDLSDQFELRFAFYGSKLSTDGVSTTFIQGNNVLPRLGYDERYRKIGSSLREDDNHVLQLDFIGKELKTGLLRHTVMVGADFRSNQLMTQTGAMKADHFIDRINFTQPFGHQYPQQGQKYVPPVKDDNGAIIEEGYFAATEIAIIKDAALNSSQSSFGVLLQDVISYQDWLKVYFGGRFSSLTSKTSVDPTAFLTGSAFDPHVGLMVNPIQALQLFGSYTTSTSLSGATNIDTLGNTLGNQTISQWEAGIKSDWLDKKLRINVTAFLINNRNMSIPVYDEQWNPTGFFTKGGNDERKGIEVEVLGRILESLEVVAGYAYIDAQYKEHTSYYEGSAPLNTPKHTANAWVKYGFQKGGIKGLSLAAGVYYIGERPVNDWGVVVTHEGMVAGQKPFMIEAVTTLNAQIGYTYKVWGINLVANNLLNKIGYNAYRTSFINQTDPRSFAVIVNYNF